MITIEDDDSPQEPPLGDEAPFEVLLSMVDDAPAPPAEPEPAPRPPEPAPRPPELAPAPEPEPVHNRSESPQPGPSGIHDDETMDELNTEEVFLRRIDDSVGTITIDDTEYSKAERVIDKATDGLHIVRMMMDQVKGTVFLLHDYKEAYRTTQRAQKRKIEECGELESKLQSESKKVKDAAEASDKKVKEARDENVLLQRQCKEAHDANGMLHRQLEVERLEAIDYKEQRDQAEIAIDELKAKLAQEKSKVYNLKKYNNALTGTLADKDASIARLETELTQTRQRLHQCTRIKVQGRPAYRQQGAAVQDSSSSSSEEEDSN